jgi:hypothetical protein
MSYQWLVAASTATALSLSIPSPAYAEPGWRTGESASTAPALSFSIPSPAYTELRWRTGEPASEWHAQDTQSAALKWELGFLALSALDTAQTIECLHRDVCEEVNPLFGKHPSAKMLILAKLGGGLAHFAAFSYLNDRDPKVALRAAQVSFALQGTVVLVNARITFK